MVHCKPNHLYNFSPVAAISNRVYSGAIGNRGYEIVKVVSSVLNHASFFIVAMNNDGQIFFQLCLEADDP
jgi:hypothetical protein